MSVRDIPFWPNASDEIHCIQACIGMAIEYFENVKLSWDELDAMTGFEAGLATWPMKSFVAFAKRGYEVLVIDTMDYADFAIDAAGYLAREYGLQSDYTAVAAGHDAAEMLNRPDIRWERRKPTIDDLRDLMRDGYIILCYVDYSAIRGGPVKMASHCVVPVSIGANVIELHNPGPPPDPAQKVSFAQFEFAWSIPRAFDGALLAIRPRPSNAGSIG